MTPAQVLDKTVLWLPGVEQTLSPVKRTWMPSLGTLTRVQAYFSGYHVNGRQIFARRRHAAAKLGIAVRTLARYLKYLSEIGWMVTIARKARTAIRKVLEPLSKPCVSSRVPSVQAGPITEELREEKRASGRGPVEMPPALNEVGRRNPIHIAICAIMRSAAERIRRARNPKAYHDAVLRRELDKLRWNG